MFPKPQINRLNKLTKKVPNVVRVICMRVSVHRHSFAMNNRFFADGNHMAGN